MDGAVSAKEIRPDLIETGIPYLDDLLGGGLARGPIARVVATEGQPTSPERYGALTVCDAVLGLERQRRVERVHRTLDVAKMRGMAPIEGLHTFEIAAGLGFRLVVHAPPTDGLLTDLARQFRARREPGERRRASTDGQS